MLSHTRRNGLIGVGGCAHCAPRGTEKTLAALLQGRVGRPFAKWCNMFVFQRATRRVGAPQLCRRAPLCRMRLQNLRRRWGSEKHRIGRRQPNPSRPSQSEMSVSCQQPAARNQCTPTPPLPCFRLPCAVPLLSRACPPSAEFWRRWGKRGTGRGQARTTRCYGTSARRGGIRAARSRAARSFFEPFSCRSRRAPTLGDRAITVPFPGILYPRTVYGASCRALVEVATSYKLSLFPT